MVTKPEVLLNNFKSKNRQKNPFYDRLFVISEVNRCDSTIINKRRLFQKTKNKNGVVGECALTKPNFSTWTASMRGTKRYLSQSHISHEWVRKTIVL